MGVYEKSQRNKLQKLSIALKNSPGSSYLKGDYCPHLKSAKV